MSAERVEPLSWLVLEQYALGELEEAERLRVERQLAHSQVDRAALAEIQADVAELPPLPLAVAATPADESPVVDPPSQVVPIEGARGRRGWTAAGMLLAAAAALLLVRLGPDDGLPPSRRTLVKGGDLAVRVVSERGGDAQGFHEGERLKLQVSCPPALAGELDAVVFQAGERYQPLPAGRKMPCGNGVPWPGAFMLDGAEPATVCVAPVDDVATADEPADLRARGVCAVLPSL